MTFRKYFYVVLFRAFTQGSAEWAVLSLDFGTSVKNLRPARSPKQRGLGRKYILVLLEKPLLFLEPIISCLFPENSALLLFDNTFLSPDLFLFDLLTFFKRDVVVIVWLLLDCLALGFCFSAFIHQRWTFSGNLKRFECPWLFYFLIFLNVHYF